MPLLCFNVRNLCVSRNPQEKKMKNTHKKELVSIAICSYLLACNCSWKGSKLFNILMQRCLVHIAQQQFSFISGRQDIESLFYHEDYKFDVKKNVNLCLIKEIERSLKLFVLWSSYNDGLIFLNNNHN